MILLMSCKIVMGITFYFKLLGMVIRIIIYIYLFRTRGTMQIEINMKLIKIVKCN